jgi:hypothetical protein
MELFVCTEQVASLHISVAFCESEGCGTALFVGMGDFHCDFFCVWMHFSSRKTVKSGIACVELHLLSLT